MQRILGCQKAADYSALKQGECEALLASLQSSLEQTRLLAKVCNGRSSNTDEVQQQLQAQLDQARYCLTT